MKYLILIMIVLFCGCASGVNAINTVDMDKIAELNNVAAAAGLHGYTIIRAHEGAVGFKWFIEGPEIEMYLAINPKPLPDGGVPSKN